MMYADIEVLCISCNDSFCFDVQTFPIDVEGCGN